MKRPALSRDELVTIVLEGIATVTRLRIPPERYGDDLFALGLDSLKAIQVVNFIEDRLDIMIDDSELKRFTSINAIADFFESLPK